MTWGDGYEPDPYRLSISLQRLAFPIWLYWGTESGGATKRVSLAWFFYSDEPWYRGRAIRVRIGDISYHLGLARRGKAIVRDVDVTAREIARWR